MAADFILFAFSFFSIWFGAGMVVRGIEDLSRKLNISSFAASFFLLGLLTSLPEISVGINSVIDRDPEIFIGNLIGASLVLFLLVMPILAILGRGIKLAHQLDKDKLIFSLLVIAAPVFLISDKIITKWEGLFLVILYFSLFYLIEKKKGLMEKITDTVTDGKTHLAEDLSQILIGSVVVFLSSSIIVDKTILFADILRISPFLISLLLLGFGTNLPELSLAIRAVNLGKKEVALGDYIGSAAANTLIFGILVFVNRGEVILANHFLLTFFFTILGLSLFYYFTRSKNDISKNEGWALLVIYVFFVILEIIS